MRFLLTTSRHNMLHRYFNSLEIVLQNEKNKKLNLYKNYTLINSNCSNYKFTSMARSPINLIQINILLLTFLKIIRYSCSIKVSRILKRLSPAD